MQIAKIALIGLALAGLASTPLAAQVGAGPLTESELVRLVVAHPDWQAVESARRRAADARAKAAGARPNTEVELLHEGADGFGGDGTQDTAQARYSLDFGGVRATEKRAGLARRDADLAELDKSALDRAMQARRLFQEVVGLRRRANARDLAAARLEAARTVVGLRLKEGDASQLEFSWVDAEAAAARTVAARYGAEAASRWAELQAYLGPAAGTYAPPSDAPQPAALPPLDAYLAQEASGPDARRLTARARAAELESEALGRRARTPNTALIGGVRSLDNPMGRTTGLIVGMTVALPFSGGPRAEAAARAADAQGLRAEQRLADATRRNAVLAAYALAQRLDAAANAAPPPPRAMIEAAEAGYEAGEIELTDLLATHRAAADAALARIELEQEAALARISLDELTGKIAP